MSFRNSFRRWLVLVDLVSEIRWFLIRYEVILTRGIYI